MRILLKPEISAWSIFNLGGKGFMGAFWLPPLIMLFALFLFYLEGRGRIRPLYHSMIISWQILISCVIIYGSFQPEAEISFGTWGITLSFIWLVIPFLLFLVLTAIHVIQEIKNPDNIPVYGWIRLNWHPLIIAILIFPFAYIFFRIGTGFNWLVKIAVGSTIIQWIMLTESLGRPYTKTKKAGKEPYEGSEPS
jgi:hypothetical protein